MLTTHLASLNAFHCAAPWRVLGFFQAQDSINSGNSKLLMIFVGIAAFALLTQALVAVFVGVGSLKALKALQTQVSELREKAMPLIVHSQTLVNEFTPKIREITDKVVIITAHVEEIAAVAREKVNEFSPTISAANKTVVDATQTVQNVNRKTQDQISRVNGMITTSLDAASRLGVAIEHGITKPGREIAGIVSGLRAGLDTLLSGARVFGSGVPIGQTRPFVHPDAPPYRTPATHMPAAPIYPPVKKVDLNS